MTRHSRRPQPVVGFRPTAAVARAKERVAAKVDKPRPWYKMSNSGTSATVLVYDEIGYYGVTAADFMADLQALGDVTNIDLHISSPGGEAFDAVAIYNGLRRHKARVTTYVDSIAASAASFIAMAGDRVLIEPTAQFMIHEASGLCIGNAADLRELAELLDRTSSTIAGIYAAAAGGTVAKWRAAMKVETWYSAEEAVAAGLADAVLSTSEPRNSGPAFRQMTARLLADAKSPAADPVAELLKKLRNR